MNSKWLVLLAGLLLGLALGAAILYGLDRSQQLQGDKPDNPVQVNGTAPDFALSTLDGKILRLADLRGRVVVLNFWATWCGPCVQEMPMLQAYALRYSSEIVVVGVNLQESASQVETFIADKEITYPILLDEDGAISQLFRVVGLPDTWIIDSQGLIRQRHIGSLSKEQFAAYLVQLGVGK